MPRDEIDRRTAPKPWDDKLQSTPCRACGALIDLRNLRQVIAHSGPLPHPVEVQRQ